MTAPLLELRNLRTRFRTDRGDLDAVRDVSFTLRAGETLGLVGESGSGKSVTGFSIMGLIDPPGRILSGEILFRGQDLTKLDEEAMRSLRGNRIAMVFQDPMMTLNPVLRISTQMIETIRAHETIDDATARVRARDLLGAMGIPSPEARLDAYPHQFSGGQRQRISIARALALQPRFLVCDESVASLDVSIQAQILNLFMQLRRELDLTYLFISHDLRVVQHIADRVVIMYLGRIVEDAPAARFFAHPNHPYTQGLLAEIPDLKQRRRVYAPVKGEIPSPAAPPPGCHFHPRCPAAFDRCRTERPALRAIAPGHRSACHLNDASAAPTRAQTGEIA